MFNSILSIFYCLIFRWNNAVNSETTKSMIVSWVDNAELQRLSVQQVIAKPYPKAVNANGIHAELGTQDLEIVAEFFPAKKSAADCG